MLISDYEFLSIDFYFGFWFRGSGSTGNFLLFGFAHVDEDEEKIKEESAFPYYYTSENGFAIWFLDEFGQWVIGEEQNR